MILRCIIVDDEPLSQEVLEKYILDVSQLSLECTCNDALEASEVLQKKNIDLIFLDINMPRISGLQLIKSIPHPPQVIFTTAYPEYAVEGFEVDAVDYLVKPFPFERFMKAVNKAIDKFEHDKGDYNEKAVIWLKSDKKINRVVVEDIIYVEAVGDYVKIKTKQGQLIVHETMGAMQEQLEPHNFIRIHRSWIISTDKID
ncbi:MAG: LytR/AlgR family response regulator transcription factor, partial [Bacteroidales bacterium]